MTIVCLADHSHEIDKHNFYENYLKLSSAAPEICVLRAKIKDITKQRPKEVPNIFF